VQETKQAKASADQWLATLRNTPGVKKEELEWIGLPEALKIMGAQGAVTKEQVLTYIAQNGVRITERVLGGELSDEDVFPFYDQMVDDAIGDQGSSHFAEVEGDEGEEGAAVWRVHGPGSDGRTFDSEDAAEAYVQELNNEEADALRDGVDVSWAEAEERARDELGANPKWSEYQAVKGGENYREITLILPKAENPTLTRSFTAGMGHWDDDNVLAHTRLSDFQDVDGNRVLMVQEVQSDWHQKGRDKGYSVAASQAEREAATVAYDAATRVMHERGAAMVQAVSTLLDARAAEVRAAKETADAAYLAFVNEHIAPGKVIAVANRWAGPPELAEAWAVLNRAKETADSNLFKVQNNIDALHYAQDDTAYYTAANTLSRQVWDGTQLGDMLDDARDLLGLFGDASLKVREADQRRAQTQGQTGIPDAPSSPPGRRW
jgi:hypothetical protein